MKKLFCAVILLISIFSLHAGELVDCSRWIFQHSVWTEQYGPIALEEKMDLEKMGLVSAKVSYDASADTGDWIDEVFSADSVFVVSKPKELVAIEEQLDQEEVVAGLKDEVLEELSKIVETNQDKETESEKAVYERRLKDGSEKLTFFQYGEEVITVQTKGLDRTFVYSDKKKISRKSYDAEMRLVKKEVWNRTNSSVAVPEMVQTYEYDGGTKPVSSVVKKNSENHIICYDSNGKIVSSENYCVYKKDDKAAGRLYKESFTSWKYDENGKLVEKVSTVYEYNKIFTKVLGQFVRKEQYQYKVSDSIPDYFYYENDELRLSTVYDSEDSYVSTMLFDGGFVIESYYKNGRRSKDIYYLNGIVRRTKTYE